MSTAPGIEFRETMKGSFALGETDPERGAASPKSELLAVHLTVTVRDLDRFISDPNHPGTLKGEVDYPPLGARIPTSEGIFRLFSPSEDSATKLMVYEVPFLIGDQAYYLAGKKEVRNDPGFDLWTDTTTLLTRLHKGIDASGEIVGAGILKLDVIEFTKVVTSIRAIDASSLVEGTQLISRFGLYFAGELWESYVVRNG